MDAENMQGQRQPFLSELLHERIRNRSVDRPAEVDDILGDCLRAALPVMTTQERAELASMLHSTIDEHVRIANVDDVHKKRRR
jgi:hypothetical protein